MKLISGQPPGFGAALAGRAVPQRKTGLDVQYEYKVVPAPARAEKHKGVKKPEERLALSLTTLMNELGRSGWEYLRADTLPCEERTGLTGKVTTSFQTLLVFRRESSAAAAPAPDMTAGGADKAQRKLWTRRPLAPAQDSIDPPKPPVLPAEKPILVAEATEGKAPRISLAEPAPGPTPSLKAEG